MKLNKSMERYNVKSMGQIETATVEMTKQLTHLEELSQLMNRKMNEANQEFDTDNFTRAKESIIRFINRLHNMELEIDELAKSVKEFTEKIRRIWEA